MRSRCSTVCRLTWQARDRVYHIYRMDKIIDTLKNNMWLILLVAAIALGAFGIFRGEAIEVFEKARLICLECIGIG